MLIVHDPRCADYGSAQRPEQPARITASVPFLKQAHPDWTWTEPTVVPSEATLGLAHSPEHLKRLQVARDFDADTPYFPGIDEHARRGVAAALTAMSAAVEKRQRAFSLMRPPGHHATQDQAMGFCYLNQIAIAALEARRRYDLKRVAVWDFDAHHGNGTEEILEGRDGFLFASVHQYPGYPGTGTKSTKNCLNWPVAPHTPAATHRAVLQESWQRVRDFKPELVLVSAGFDAFAGDPITAMTLQISDFRFLGELLHEADFPVAAILEGGYSQELPELIEAFLKGWEG
ncbi:MAG TPA: histone deacetylase [Opitutaceae bacterium]|nr:histone deacetylase [Opitutaceae bacterium]